MNMDMDMDMDDDKVDIRGSLSPTSPFQLPNRPPKIIAPPRLQEGSHFSYGRLPTPISSHSQTASPQNMFASGRIPTPIHPHFPHSDSYNHPHGLMSPSQPSTSALFSGHSPIRLLPGHSPNRPMPSPIREDSMDDATTDFAGSQLSRLSVNESMMDMDEGSLIEPGPYSPTDTPRKGRARSGAMLSPNKRLFIGYMSDCEKCRMNVPGHSVHILS
ncbi:hypothetical protein BT63DRAFT_128675 [Microthyrium microscopicum]|uniref:Uncharacterized protein n=1 Tax=Microthyrium microscopicum TaxID=703497 RepID=A0A6A6TW36_9PEZI|nr:hypothetical protein BT63DRAFT_128675 [Microthyrium microscopicum]